MSWLDDMNADALAIAAPGFELQPGDEIHLKLDYEEDYAYSSVTLETGYFRITVEVWRPTDLDLTDRSPNGEIIFRRIDTGKCYYDVVHECYLSYEAREFFTELMVKGSKRA